jgi:hypothetical protein
MGGLLYWTGAFVWGVIALAAVWVVGWTLYCLAGFIYGMWRLRSLGIYKPETPAWWMLRRACREWLREWPTTGGWYVQHGGKKVYRFGFQPIVDDDLAA